MAKNELLPFADGEDANVLPTNQWEALTDILENGFQSGIAKSEQVNRVLAQGAVASYVLGQLIVDQLNKNATLDKDTLYQNLILALQENAKDACLPLSGGTMTGSIRFSQSGKVYASADDSFKYACLFGGNDGSYSGAFEAFASDSSRNAGGFNCRARGPNGEFYDLEGRNDGSLKWKGKGVVCVEYWRNGSSWYRKYSDGFIEQGGYFSSNTQEATATFNTPFTTMNFQVMVTLRTAGSGVNYNPAVVGKTATGFTYNSMLGKEFGADYYACGY